MILDKKTIDPKKKTEVLLPVFCVKSYPPPFLGTDVCGDMVFQLLIGVNGGPAKGGAESPSFVRDDETKIACPAFPLHEHHNDVNSGSNVNLVLSDRVFFALLYLL